MKAFDYAIAENQQGIHAAVDKGYKVKASGIDLLDMLKERIEPSEKLVSIHKVKPLKEIRMTDGGVSIGALATLREISENEAIKKGYPALALAAGEAATPQIRARATAAGNILQRPRCWYFRAKEYHCLKKGGAECFAVNGENTYHAIFGEGPCHITHPSNIAPALVAAGAKIKASNGSEEKEYDAEDFFVMPTRNLYGENILEDDEVVTEIVIPAMPEKSAYVEFREKQSFDWPVAACIAVYMDGKWSVVLSHVAQTPWRAEEAEKIAGTMADLTKEVAEKAADAEIQRAEPMSQNAYRIKLARAAIRRSLLKACGKEAV